MSNNILETVSGKMIDILNLKPEDIRIEDIAWSLSRMPRFAGSTITEIPYTVGQHSIMVTDIVCRSIKERETTDTIPAGFLYRHALAALLHDAAEFLIGDIPSPTKKHPKLVSAIDEIESHFMDVILQSFKIDSKSIDWTIIKSADLEARAIEAYWFMYSRGKNWNLPDISFKQIQEFQMPKPAIIVYENFMNRFNEITATCVK